MTNYYIPNIYIVPLISVDGQASPRLFIAPEIRHEKISYKYPYPHDRHADKDSYSHDRNVTDDLCSLIKLCFAFMHLLWFILRLNVFYFFHVENYLLKNHLK